MLSPPYCLLLGRYGAKLIIDGKKHGCDAHGDCLTGGTIIAVFFCVIVGASGLGQLTPPLSAFFAAKAAMGSVLEVIERKPLIDGLSDEGEVVFVFCQSVSVHIFVTCCMQPFFSGV